MSPLCESYLTEDKLDTMEPFYPLNVWVCHQCFLVQINDYVAADEIFTEYAYYSSFSTSWLQHASDYVDMITDRLGLGPDSFVVELASNDGYLLQYFVKKGIPCLGRHHLPRAFLLLLADQCRGDLRQARDDDLRRRGAVDPRRFAAHLRPAGGRREPSDQ
jgi:hypothetical protein